jgi:hypothetical protein
MTSIGPAVIKHTHVDKLDNIQACFIHYQLLRFCQATRLQYLNGQVQLANQQVLQQQHVDHKIANAGGGPKSRTGEPFLT